MNKIRYIDNKILCEYDFKEELFKILDIKVNDIIPLRKVYVLFTDKGKKVLKITNSTKNRIDFIDKSLNIIEEEYPNVLKYTKNIYGEVITKWQGKDYVLLDMVEGREASFTNPIEIKLCSEAIAKMHIASRKVIDKFSKEEIDENSGVNLITRMECEFNELCNLESLVKKYKYKNKFDELFISNIEKAKFDLDKTIDDIISSEYNNIFKKKEDMVLCHNDLAHHNFIVDGEKISMIDFDYCNIDTKISDIYCYVSKVSKGLAYDKETINSIIGWYNEINSLELEEIEILNKLMTYPKDFISICSNYYFKQKAWSEEVFLTRLQSKLTIDSFRIDLIENK